MYLNSNFQRFSRLGMATCGLAFAALVPQAAQAQGVFTAPAAFQADWFSTDTGAGTMTIMGSTTNSDSANDDSSSKSSNPDAAYEEVGGAALLFLAFDGSNLFGSSNGSHQDSTPSGDAFVKPTSGGEPTLNPTGLSATPEPSAWVGLGMGIAGLSCLTLRARRQTQAA